MKAAGIYVGWKKAYLMIRIKQKVESGICHQRTLYVSVTRDVFERS